MKMSFLDRILFLITGLLAAYQIAVGINGLNTIPTIAYTIAFGILLVTGLLIIILGVEILDLPVVVILSTIIPLSLATGLVWQYLPSIRTLYLIFTVIGFLAIVISRARPMKNKLPVLVLAVVHAIAGLTIFLLPIILVFNGGTTPGFALVSIGGALIGLGGLLLALLKAGKPILSREAIFRIFPVLMLMMTFAFVAGFALAS